MAGRKLMGLAATGLALGFLASCAARSDVGNLEARVMQLERNVSNLQQSVSTYKADIDAARESADAARRAAEEAAESSKRTERMFNKSLKK